MLSRFTGAVGTSLRRQGRQFSSYGLECVGNEVEGFLLRTDAEYRIFFKDAGGKRISPWHDIPLFADSSKRVVNFVNEIPRGSVEKMEVATKEEFNPIKQDKKKEKLRNYPFASLVNYGCLPQTWEDNTHKDENTGLLGDKDPLDVVEIGSRIAASGEVYPVKLLGILGMVDEGEMDWKVLAIAADDPDAAGINSVQDLEAKMPGKIDEITRWFKFYKVPDGKPVNEFAFDEQALDLDFTFNVVEQTHQMWKATGNLKAQDLWAP